MEDIKKTNAVELDDDALENAAGGVGVIKTAVNAARGKPGGRVTDSSITEEERAEEQKSENV